MENSENKHTRPFQRVKLDPFFAVANPRVCCCSSSKTVSTQESDGILEEQSTSTSNCAAFSEKRSGERGATPLCTKKRRHVRGEGG